MGIDLRGAHVFMSQLLLNRADIHASFKQVGGEGMPQGVAAGLFGNTGAPYCHLDGLLNGAGIDMMTALHPAARIDGAAAGGKYILPTPFPAGV